MAPGRIPASGGAREAGSTSSTLTPVVVWPPHTAQPAPPLEPASGTSYPQLFRVPGRRRAAPLVSLAVLLGSYVAMIVALGIAIGLVFLVVVSSTPISLDALLAGRGVSGWASVGVLLLLNLALAALIPAVLLANKVAHPLPTGYTHSIVGRFRFGWFGLVTAVLVPVWSVYVVVAWLVEPIPLFTHVEAPLVTATFILVCLVTTPLQAAGEEYFFRGWLMQNIGVAIPRPVVALVVPTVTSAVLFVAAHGSLDPWIVLSLGASAVAACWMTWRTGGLEAAVSMHAVNNVVIIVGQAAFGVPFVSGLVTEQSTSTPAAGLLGVASSAVAVALVEILARRRGITPTR